MGRIEDQLRTFEAPALGNLKFTVWDREGAPWFIAKEVLNVLGIKADNIKYQLRNLANDDYVRENMNKIPNPTKSTVSTGNPLRWFISESGLYKLIMRPNKPEAAQFQDWVTKVVLPAIRKDGAYIEGEEKLASGEMSEEEFVLQAAEFAHKAMEIMRGKLDRLSAENQKMTTVLTEVTIAEKIMHTKVLLCLV